VKKAAPALLSARCKNHYQKRELTEKVLLTGPVAVLIMAARTNQGTGWPSVVTEGRDAS